MCVFRIGLITKDITNGDEDGIPVPGLPPFDTMDEPNTLWLKWKKLIRSFNLHLAAKGVDSDGQKVALVLYMGGMEFHEIFYKSYSKMPN